MRNFFIFIIALCCVFLIAACSIAHSENIGPHKYRVTSSGNVWASKSDHMDNVREEAEEVCGDSNYTITGNEDDAFVSSVPSVVNGIPMRIPSTGLVAEFECH